MLETIGERLRKLREEKGITLEEAGKVAGKTRQSMYKYEHNIITNIPSDAIAKLANLYGVKPSYIMGWNKDTPRKEVETAIEIAVKEKLKQLDAAEQQDVLEYINFKVSKSKGKET